MGLMNLPVQAHIVDPEAAYRQSRMLAFPSRVDLHDAVASIPRREHSPLSRYAAQHSRQSPRAYEGPKWFLNVSPGTVQLRRLLMAPKATIGHTDGMAEQEAPTRGRISEWSDKSRRRMVNVLHSLDYAPMFESGGEAAMVTLTLPGQQWEELVPSPRHFAELRKKWQDAYRYAWGALPVAVWKMEFQRRGAPHLHLFMVPPRGVSRGRGGTEGLPFSRWLSRRWADLVAANLDGYKYSSGYKDHVLAGTRVDYVEGQKFSDPRRAAVYFSKHGEFAAKEYQNVMPEHWSAAIREGRSQGGNFWGYWQLEKLIETVELRPTMRRASIIDGEPVMRRHAQPSAIPDELRIVGIMSVQANRARRRDSARPLRPPPATAPCDVSARR